jgi:hypothetical protein
MDLLHRATSFLRTASSERDARARLARLDDRSLADMGLVERAPGGRFPQPGEPSSAPAGMAVLTRQALGLRAV